MRSRNRLVIPVSGRHAGVWCGCEPGEGSLHFSLSQMISLVRNEEASALSRSPRVQTSVQGDGGLQKGKLWQSC